MGSEKKHLYFPNLNGLRFIAAFLVMLNHLEWMKSVYGITNLCQWPLFYKVGDLGVTLFFVLSGFLITYLLLYEKKETGDISIKNFYIRRILRIWPLYYLTVILAFFVFPYFFTIKGMELQMFSGTYFKQFFLFMFLMANVSYCKLPLVSFASQLWSVGVEEQFYVFWPYLNKKISRNIHKALIYIIVSIVAVRIICIYLSTSCPQSSGFLFLSSFFQHFRIQAMAIGGLAAWTLINKKENILRFLYGRDIQWICLIMCVISIVTPFEVGVFHHEYYSLLFMIIILNAASNKENIFKLENRVFLFLGKISYGLYVYQVLAIYLSLKITMRLTSFKDIFYSNSIYYSLAIFISIFISFISFKFFEEKLLRLKGKFSAILSN